MSPSPASPSDKNDENVTEPTSPTENRNGHNVRLIVGSGMERFSALINDNLIAARFGAVAGIALLTVSSKKSGFSLQSTNRPPLTLKRLLPSLRPCDKIGSLDTYP